MSARMLIGCGVLALLVAPGASAEANLIGSFELSWANRSTLLSSWPRELGFAAAPSPPLPILQPSIAIAPVASPPVASSPAAPPIAPQPPPSPPPVANAFVNLGNGPFAGATALTTGGAQPWYESQSPALLDLFGGAPTPQQQAAFSAAVMQRVEETFQLSGVNVRLTTDPSAPAAHTLSLVSNTTALALPSAIGMTFIGGNGFSFIDQQAALAQSLDQLEWVTAHNIAHELMLAFGVGESYDTTGAYIDARNAQGSMLTSPGATFSPAAAAALNQALAEGSNNTAGLPMAQVIDLHAVPEPTVLAFWTLAIAGVLAARPRRAPMCSSLGFADRPVFH